MNINCKFGNNQYLCDMKSYAPEQIDKIGNTIIYLANSLADLSKTKLLKLLYILEEQYVMRYHIPFFELDFEVWQAGPVARDIFIDLSQNPVLLQNYIERVQDEDRTYIRAKREFLDDEFSDNEIEMIDFIIKRFGGLNATDLVKYTHRKSSLWHQTAKEIGVLEPFEKGLLNSTEEKIDFNRILGERERVKYKEQIAHNNFVNTINA